MRDTHARTHTHTHTHTHTDAIVGVNFFSEGDPGDFGRFDRTFYGLYRILGGESWFEHLTEVI